MKRIAIVGIVGAFVATVGVRASGDPVPAAEDTAPAVAACVAGRRFSACLVHKAEDGFKNCIGSCIEQLDARDDKRADDERVECEKRYLDDQGKKAQACRLGGNQVAASREDLKKLEAALGEAIARRNAEQLDAVFARVAVVDTAKRERDCTAACNTRGRSWLRAPVEGPALVQKYKLCMVHMDSTKEARKFALYERDLYREFLEKADKACRETAKCDWVEEFTSLRCVYNPL